MSVRPKVSSRPWGQTLAGETVTLYTLQAGEVTAEIMNYGGVIVRLLTPDRDGIPGDIVLGHDHLEAYLDRSTASYFGAVIGRYGNRIAQGRFTLDGQIYQLACNNGPNALHGGPGGFDQQLWEARASAGSQGARLELRRRSPDGEEGYPGNLDVTVVYTLMPQNVLQVEYQARTDAATVLNLTQHTYWNLTGGAKSSVLNHQVQIAADKYTPVDCTLIPTGELPEVAGTPFDFRSPRKLGEALDQDADHPQLTHTGGYDHNFVLSGGKQAAVIYEPISGRTLRVETTEPGVQFYSGNFLDGSVVGKDGRRYERHWGFCLETQHFPDSPNQTGFPSTVLRPGEMFKSVTHFVFATGSKWN